METPAQLCALLQNALDTHPLSTSHNGYTSKELYKKSLDMIKRLEAERWTLNAELIGIHKNNDKEQKGYEFHV
jgi:hypothetical protein